MKSFDTELKKHAEKIRLKAVERREMRERILSYMEYHPLPKREEVPLRSVGEVHHGAYMFVPWNSRSMRLVGGVFAAFLFIVVPLMAEYAVPGDVLYLVKTGVNEGIQGTLANSPYEKVTFETKLIERRLSEARLLASEGKLTSDVEAHIIETVQGHADAVQSGLAELRADDAEEAAMAEIEVNSALEVQSVVLGVNESTDETSSVGNLLAMVNTVREEVASNPESSVPSFDGLTARIEKETTRSHELFESVKNSVSPEDIIDIERRFADIDRKILAARELHITDETGSVVEMIDALGLIQKLIAYMTDIDVQETVALESLVPVVLTNEERVTALNVKFDDIEKRRRHMGEELPVQVDVNILSKAEGGFAMLETLLTEAASARDAGAVDVAETRVTEASALIEDLEMVLRVNEVIALPTEIASTTETGTTTEESVPPENTPEEESVEPEVVTE